MKKFKKQFANWALVKSIVSWSKQSSLPGFRKVPIYDVVDFFFKELKRDSIAIRAGAMAFNFLLAIFPTVIFLFTLIPHLPIDTMDVLTFLDNIVPDALFGTMESAILDIVNKQRTGLLSLGFFIAFFFATNGVFWMMNGFNKSYPIFKKRSGFRKRLIAAFLTGLLVLLFFASIALVLFGSFLIKRVAVELDLDGNVSTFLATIFVYLTVVLLYFSVIATVFHFGPSVTKKWKFITPGSTLATTLSILASLTLAYYFNELINFNQIYGSLGTLIGVMIWLYINSIVLLIGFELNASIDINLSLQDQDE